MEITIAKPTQKPKVTSVVVVDPASHSGLSTGSLSNDYRFLQCFADHSNLNVLFNDAKNYRHPNIRLRGDANSGSGVFVVTKEGNLLWCTLTGTTSEVTAELFWVVEQYAPFKPIIMIERPLPQNAATLFSCAYMAGALALSFDTEPVLLPPKKFNQPHHRFKLFLNQFGVEYTPTPHELDATLHYIETFYYLDDDSYWDNQPVDNDDVGTTEQLVLDNPFSLIDYRTVDAMVNGHKNEQITELLNDVLGQLSGGVSVKSIRKRFANIAKHVRGATSFRI